MAHDRVDEEEEEKKKGRQAILHRCLNRVYEILLLSA